jgi:hypothetical protein
MKVGRAVFSLRRKILQSAVHSFNLSLGKVDCNKFGMGGSRARRDCVKRRHLASRSSRAPASSP